MKFIKHHMESILGIEIFPVIAFLIFFSFFVVLLIWVYKHDKTQLDEIANMPLEENNPEPLNDMKS